MNLIVARARHGRTCVREGRGRSVFCERPAKDERGRPLDCGW